MISTLLYIITINYTLTFKVQMCMCITVFWFGIVHMHQRVTRANYCACCLCHAITDKSWNKLGGLSRRDLLWLCHQYTCLVNLCLICQIITTVIGLTEITSPEFLGTALVVLVKVTFVFYGNLCCISYSSTFIHYFVYQRILSCAVGTNWSCKNFVLFSPCM